MRRILNGLARDERGAVALVFIFAVVGMFGFVALAIDTGMWYAGKLRAQTAADAAARAGAFDLMRVTSTDDDIRTLARSDAAKFGFTDARGAMIAVNISRPAASVEAVISMPATLNFARMFLHAPPVVTARATAAAPQSPPPCLTILEPTGSGALDMSEVSTRIAAPNCRVQVNSTHGKAIDGSNGFIEAAQICVGGGKVPKIGTSVPVEKCPPLADPMASWMPPAMPGTCDFTATRKIDKQTAVLEPGKYCDGIQISNSKVTLNPGVYYIPKGKLEIKDFSEVTGNAVAFLLGGDAVIAIQKSTVRLTAPATGQMAGILFAHTRDAKAGAEHNFDGSGLYYEGAVYLPSQRILYKNRSDSKNVPPFTTFIVAKLKIEDGSTLILDNDYAASDVPVVGKIGSSVVLTK